MNPSTGAFVAREGIDYEVLFDVAEELPDGRRDLVKAISAEGWALVARRRPGVPINPGGQILIKDRSGERVVPTVLDGPSRQARDGAVSANGETAVWTETTSTSLDVADWELFDYEGGAPRHLASSSMFESRGVPPPPEYDPLTVDERAAYLTAVLRRPEDPKQLYTVIIRAPLDGSKASIFVPDAHLPAASPRGLYFARVAGASRTTRQGVTEIWLAPADGASPRLVRAQQVKPGVDQVRSLCAAGDYLVWVTGNASTGGHGRITILGPDGTTKQIPIRQSGWDTSLSCSNDMIGWSTGSVNEGEDNTQYLYSLSDDRLWQVGQGSEYGGWVQVNGKTVGFLSMPHGGVVRVVRWLH